MKSVGEAMAIGRTFQQAFAKAHALARARHRRRVGDPDEQLLDRLAHPAPDRYDVLLEAFRAAASVEESTRRTRDRPVVPARAARAGARPAGAFAGERTFKSVDTCAAEFAAETPYYYSGWERPARRPRHEVRRGDKPERGDPRLGAQPHRPGHRVRLLLRARRDDRPRVRPRRGDGQLQPGDGLHRLRHLRPAVLRAADARGRARGHRGRAARGRDRPVRRPDAAQARRRAWQTAGVPLLGTSVDAIDLAEDRGALRRAARRASATRRRRTPPPHSADEALAARREVGFPLLVRPSYVLGGRAMEIVYSRRGPRRLPAPHRRARRRTGADGARSSSTASWRTRSRSTSTRSATARTSGSAGSCSTSRRPASTRATRPACCRRTRSAARCSSRSASRPRGIALALGVVGLMNVQYAVHDDDAVRDRGQPARLAHRAVRVQGDRRPAGQDGLPDHARRADRRPRPARRPMAGDHVSVKEAVLPFDRFQGSDALLGPEMRSTGEVMGVARDFPTAFAKAQAAAGARCRSGHRVHHRHRRRQGGRRRDRRAAARPRLPRSSPRAAPPQAIARMGVPVEALNKIGEGSPNVVDWIERGDVDLVVNTPTGSGARTDGWEIRRAAVARGIPCITTLSRRPGGRAGDRAARARASPKSSRCRSCTPRAPDGPAQRRRWRSRTAPAARVSAPPRRPARPAPFGARARVVANRRSAPTRAHAPPTRTARRPRPGQFYMLAAAEGWGGGADERPSCRAPSRSRRGRDGGPSWSSCSRTSGPGTHRLCELRRGEALWLLGPLGRGFARRPHGRRAVLVRRRRRHGAAGHLAGRAAGARAPPRCCSAFATAAHADGAELLARRAAWPPTTARSATTACHRAARRRARRDPTPRSTPAARRRCSRRCARCAPSAACPASWRWSPGWPAASAPASAASCPRAAATCACASTGRSSTPRSSSGLARHAIAPGDAGAPPASTSTSAACASRTRSSTARAPSTRSPAAARFGDALLSASRSPPSSPRRSPSRRGPATRRRGCGRRRRA